jgi:hypothetical protein
MLGEAARALHSLRRRPAVPLLGALGLSAGLGVTAAVFSLLDAVLLRPLPGASPERLVAIHGFQKKDAAYTDVSYAGFRDLAEGERSLDLDLALGASSFEIGSLERATDHEFEPACVLRTCSAEDLIVHKSVAAAELKEDPELARPFEEALKAATALSAKRKKRR